MLNKILICAALLLALNVSVNLSAAVERHALVIGNANYAANPLRNPVNDARDMGARLTELGFQVELLLDADLPTMLSGVIEFGKGLDDNSVGLFYFAGHGMQAYNLQSDSDSNFLLPVNFAMSDEKQLPFDTLDVNRVVSAMSGSRSGGANIIILDACRDNPYERSFRTSSRGLTQMAGAEGLLIAYATAPGKVAADGDGRNGLFTEQLLLALDQPGQPVETVFKLVRQGVAGASGRAQVPFVSNGLIGDFYFNPVVAGKTPEPEQLITLTLRSNVYDDQVYINGAYAGQTKLVTQLAVGWHDIEVRKSGYQTYSARLFLDKDQTLVARLQRGADPTPQPAITQVVIAPPSSSTQSTSNTIDGFSLDDWLLLQQGAPVTIASIEKIMAYERQHGGNAASRSYINKGIKVALANVNSADDLLEYQRKFGYLPGAPAQIEARLAELLAAGASRQDLIRLRAQFPASATLRLQLAGEYHQAQLFDAAAGEYQSWLGLTDSSHPERKRVLEALVAAREGRLFYKAGDTIQDCPECPQMVYIPTGAFRMGDIQGGGDSDEKPVHRVSVKAFLMSATEVTFDQWDACVAAGGCDDSGPRSAGGDNGWGRGTRPVIEVSWEDAQQYVKWISAKTGKQYRLPTEAEWEYAARAGSETKYSWGNSIGNNKANCDGCGSRWDDSKTAPVASFTANAFGLYDMHGNVWEWTQDCWNGSYKGAPGDGSAWLSGECGQRVLRGGSWSNFPNDLRSAYRNYSTTGFRISYIGFRLARTLD